MNRPRNRTPDPEALTPKVLAALGWWIDYVDQYGSNVLTAREMRWQRVIAVHGVPAAIALLSYGQPGGLTRNDIPVGSFLGCGHPPPAELSEVPSGGVDSGHG